MAHIIQLSFDQVKQRNELSAKLLRLWAYFDNQDLWFELLRHSDSEDPDWVRELTEDKLAFNGAVRVLSDHGLVEVDMSSQELIESRGYSIHGCVHSWTVNVLNQEWDSNLARLALKFVGSHVPEKESAKWWLTQRRLLPHAASISKSVNQPRVPEVNAGLRGKGAEMLQAIRPGVSAGLTPPLPGFLSLPAFYIPYYWRSPCSRQSRGIYVYSINTGLLFYSPDLLDYHDYI